jgi:hypothetical protein
MENSIKITPQEMRAAVNTPEVQEAMKVLSKYGLAVWLPHMHAEDGGDEPLTRKVNFVERDSLDYEDLKQTAVAWVWNDSMNAAVVATSCTDEKTRHG